MLRSMYSGISGMRNFQTKLDVIGNNIANVNTFGYKKGRTTFQDMVSQQLAGATAPGANRGGVNPRQVGLGMQLASIDNVHTQGSLQNTNRELDLGISGDGFFQVQDGDTFYYTRSGNFYFDQQGTIVNAQGLRLMDTNGNPITVPTTAQSFSIGQDGTVTYIDEDGDLQEAGMVRLVNFANPEGLAKAGANLYLVSANSGAPLFTSAGNGGTGDIIAGTLEMSNVDLSEEFTEMIVAQRGFQANTRIITTSDEILQELVNLKR
ncbi:flagellar basal body rod protein FlgG [Halalkalibacterium halodurans]|uniref:Flagellar hook protein n=2 Tax=Halalkalibacterium halodurans TaxID=86665 RepID=Q9KA41_HALH5|nr:flagellar basal body rod protein FlgG [Halalkalibacterium halodurans]MDY7222997.1 flagellar basal body rod protein FlgG [Halalkalibacterium halodurans]MDY7242218.1 flagellar basal body rod protein FlgG [Halalkalibacterium halodurans]MED3646174.1 flagellar basal body rod protein FlgG [Halalkalibacterium halodurans]MED4124443.1 flagellar basal body rod protein FlgG [Halalkalibacterium halodurans]MED4164367.1 flagellar basal body rod protein FlgG [Halalkalibacterium halodurans]